MVLIGAFLLSAGGIFLGRRHLAARCLALRGFFLPPLVLLLLLLLLRPLAVSASQVVVGPKWHGMSPVDRRKTQTGVRWPSGVAPRPREDSRGLQISRRGLAALLLVGDLLTLLSGSSSVDPRIVSRAIDGDDVRFVLASDSIRSRRVGLITHREALGDLRFVHYDRAFGILDRVDDKTKLKKTLGTLQCLIFAALDRSVPSLAAAVAMYVPPNRIDGPAVRRPWRKVVGMG
jgi:hypothetical protein